MVAVGKTLLLLGLGLVLIGALLWLLGRLGFRGLPGDLRYEGEQVRVYVPIVTCIVVSLLLTAIAWLWHWLRAR